MSYLLINEDGTTHWLNDAAAPMDPRLSDNDNDNDDDDFEQLYVEARESSSPGSDYVKVECKTESDSSPNTTQVRLEESYAELSDEYPSSYVAVSSDDEKLVAEYNAVANHYCDDSQYRNQYLTTKLQSAYENILSKQIDNNDTVIGYISVLIGQVTQELAKTNSYSVLYSDEITDALMRYDIFLKMLDETDISEEVQVYAKGRYYQCIGDVMSARFAARDHNEENRWVLINYAMCAYSVAMNYLKNLTINRGINDAHLKVVRCEIKICLDYAFSYYDMVDGVKESLSDKTFGSELSVELYAKLEDEEDECLVSESFLATNDEDVYGSESLDDSFNFNTDFVDHAAEVWKLRDTHNFLDHLLFIIGYSKPHNYDFVPVFFPNLKPGPVSSAELSIIETFLAIVSMSIEFCQVPCNQFGYDVLYRKRMELPEIEHHSTGDSDVERAIILPVSRHERHGHVKTLIWKALLEVGQDPEELQPSEIYSSKRMLSEMIRKIKNEVHVTEALHNGYIVSERFHLMLNWYHDRELLDRESKILLNAHLKYLRRRLPFKPSRDTIREASKTGDILTQKFPDLHLEWLFYPIGSSCDCVHVPNVYELIDYINIFAYERGSPKYKELTAKLSPSFQAVMAEKELKANEVPGKPFSDEFLAKSKALEEECNALKRELGYSIPEHLSWDRIREVAQSSGQKLGHTKYQAGYKALSMEMRELTLFYRAETARNMKPQPPLPVSDLPHHVELRKTCALFCEALENHGKWLCEKLRSIRRREEESRIRLYSIIYAPDFPYNELLDVAKFIQDPLNIPPPDHLEATLKMLNDALELQANGYAIPPEDIQQSTSFYAANLSDAQCIQRELSNLSIGDQQRVSTTLDYVNGQVTDEGFSESMALIDNIFGPTVALNPTAKQSNASECTSQIASTSTAAEATDHSATPSPVSLPSVSTPPAATVPISKPDDKPKADEKPSEAPATSAGNDSFKKAFQQWRRIYDDTPEHIVAEVLTPALTKSSLANYKPVIHAGARPETDPLEELERLQADPPAPQEDSLYISDDDEESYAEDGYDEEENIDAYDTEDAEDYDYEDPDADVY